MSKQRRLVVVGGQYTGAGRLWHVAEAAVQAGLGDDAEVYTLGRGMRSPGRLARHIRGARVVQHSLASVPVRRAVAWDSRPELVVDFNGVEPMTYAQMVARAAAKLRAARRGIPSDRSIALHNLRQGLLHPIDNTVHLPHVTRFSTSGALAQYRRMGVSVLAVRHDGDLLVPYDERMRPDSMPVLQRPGTHDQILTHPHEEIPHALAVLAQHGNLSIGH